MSGTSPFEGVTTLVIDAFGTIVKLGRQLDVPAVLRPVLLAALRDGVPGIGWEPVWQPYNALLSSDYRGVWTPREFWLEYISRVRSMMAGTSDSMYTDIFATPQGVLVSQLQRAEASLYADASRMPMADHFLATANRTGFRIVLCSNATQSGWQTLQRLGVADWFAPENWAVSCLAGAQKAPERQHRSSLFDWVADVLGVVPADALVIEDEPRYTRIAGKLGYRTALVHCSEQNPGSTVSVTGGVMDLMPYLVPVAPNPTAF